MWDVLSLRARVRRGARTAGAALGRRERKAKHKPTFALAVSQPLFFLHEKEGSVHPVIYCISRQQLRSLSPAPASTYPRRQSHHEDFSSLPYHLYYQNNKRSYPEQQNAASPQRERRSRPYCTAHTSNQEPKRHGQPLQGVTKIGRYHQEAVCLRRRHGCRRASNVPRVIILRLRI